MSDDFLRRIGIVLIIDAIALVVLLLVVLPAQAWTGYDPQQRAAFRATHPCPATGKTKGACPGYVTDHIIPLCSGAPDVPANMQWQKRRASLAKDKREAAYCACLKRKGPDACVFKP